MTNTVVNNENAVNVTRTSAKKKFDVLTVIKALIYIQILNIYCVRAVVGAYIPYCTQLTGVAAIALMLYHMWTRHVNFSFLFTKPMMFWLVFIVYSVVCALGATNSLTSILDFVEKYAFIIIVCYICYYERDLSFPFQLAIVISFFCSVISFTNSGSLNDRNSLSDVTSTNEMGNIAMTGFVCILFYKPDKNILGNQIVRTVLMICYLIAVVLTASRQSLLLMMMAFVFRVFLCHRPADKRKAGGIKLSQVFFCLISVAIILIIVYKYFPLFYETKLYSRLAGTNIATDVSDNTRLMLYKNGLALWKRHPYFGVGYNFVRNYIGYSHSTYIEILAGSGFFGFIFFFGAFVSLIANLIRRWSASPVGSVSRFNAKYMICLCGIIMVLAATRAVHYYIISMLLIAILFTYDSIIRSDDPEIRNKV